MKNIFKKIEIFLTSVALLGGILYAGGGLNGPKKKDYIARILLSLLGLFITCCLLFMVVIFLSNFF